MPIDLTRIDRNNAADDHNGDFPLIDPGYYVMHMTQVKEAQSSANDTQFELTWEFDENYHPELKGRKVWYTLCLFHHKDTPRNIAIRELRDMENASIGRQASTMEELLHRPMAVKIEIEPEDKKRGYKAKNRPRAWEPVASRFGNGQAAQPTQAPAPAAQQAPAANGAGPAWLNNNAQ